VFDSRNEDQKIAKVKGVAREGFNFNEGMDEMKVYVIYQLCEGESLAQHFGMLNATGVTMDKEQFLFWALSMAQTVQFLHDEAGITHGDLHFGNWLMQPNGQIVLSDFGCAYMVSSEAGGQSVINTGLNFCSAKDAPTYRQDIIRLADTFTSMICHGNKHMIALSKSQDTLPTYYG